MALSANKVFDIKHQPYEEDLKVVNGAVHIYEGALLNYEAGNIGYVMPGTDVLSAEFAGIAVEELNVAAADNVSDGTFSVRVLTRGCGEIVELDVTSSITIANEGDAVYVDTDEYVDISSGILNTTGGFVGIIRKYISAHKALVQMCQHPTL